KCLEVQTHQVSDQIVDNNAQEALPATTGYNLVSILKLLRKMSYFPEIHSFMNTSAFIYYHFKMHRSSLHQCYIKALQGGCLVLKSLAIWPSATERFVGIRSLNFGICYKFEAPDIVMLELKGCGVLFEASIVVPV
ncbi:hypothetical protein MKX03_034093, partial [Papaver bracteatum]